MSSSIICCLIPKTIIKILYRSHIIVKYTGAKDFLNEMNCKHLLISNTLYERWHSKLFTNCHVSWDTLYYVSTFVGHPVLTLNRRRVRRIERKDDFYSGLFTEIKIVLGITIYLKKILKGGHVQIPQSKITYI